MNDGESGVIQKRARYQVIEYMLDISEPLVTQYEKFSDAISAIREIRDYPDLCGNAIVQDTEKGYTVVTWFQRDVEIDGFLEQLPDYCPVCGSGTYELNYVNGARATTDNPGEAPYYECLCRHCGCTFDAEIT